MRKLLLVAAAVIPLVAVTALDLSAPAGAQSAPSQAVITPSDPPAGGPAGPGGPERRAGRWRMAAHHGRFDRFRRIERLRTFALFYRPDDRHLTPPDVQKIVEGFLLWNGNHSWTVTDVAAGEGTAIGFAIATSDGSVIARFTMDSKTGRVTRTG